MLELLTNSEMGTADRLAMAGGVSGLKLMEAAGSAVAEVAARRAGSKAGVAVLCGPGNNGGDGYVAARKLREAGYDVRVFVLAAPANPDGDAAQMAQLWSGSTQTIDEALSGAELVVDALFGAGLTRAIEGTAAAVIEKTTASGIPVLAVDVPSGLDGSTGKVTGPHFQAAETVTFFRKKPGHLLMPGRALCGPTRVADIGIPVSVLDEIAVRAFENDRALWEGVFPWPGNDAHKYRRGHVIVVSGSAHRTGAARLSARAALRTGAGLVTLVGDQAATSINAVTSLAVMTRAVDNAEELIEFVSEKRNTACLIGPAAGVGIRTAGLVLGLLKLELGVVLDADALTSFGALQQQASDRDRKHAAELFDTIRAHGPNVVMTPHEGEFERLFGDVPGSKLERARTASKRSGAVIVLKGPDTVIAAPDGRVAINCNAPVWLATAGSGDVLAGLIAGLVGQKMLAFEAACAAVWLHGEAGTAIGPGLISEDLTEQLPRVLQELWSLRQAARG